MASLPTASRINVEKTILLVVKGDQREQLTQARLKDESIGQHPQSLALLNFLRLLEKSGRLHEDVIKERERPKTFQRLLIDRVKSEYPKSGDFGSLGITLDHFGTDKFVIPSDKKANQAAKKCLMALNHVAIELGRRQQPDGFEWLEKEVATYQKQESEDNESGVVRSTHAKNSLARRSTEGEISPEARRKVSQVLKCTSGEPLRVIYGFRNGKVKEAVIQFEDERVDPEEFRQLIGSLEREYYKLCNGPKGSAEVH